MREIKDKQSFTSEPKIAYFSMEIGLENDIPTYSGGLGVLAGDTIRSAADLGLPMVAVTLICRKGYFRQEIDQDGHQIEHPVEWKPEKYMKLLPERVSVRIEGRTVQVQAWLYEVRSVKGGVVPVYLLDTGIPGNTEEDRAITDHLYGGDDRYRLKQEIVLGIGGMRFLEELGLYDIHKYHMNEGHASLLTLELLKRFKKDIEDVWVERLVWNADYIREFCVFTTHTPVEAGHDKFPYDLVGEVMGEVVPMNVLKKFAGEENLNMTLLALNLSHYVNGVAKKHGEVSQGMFPGYEINAITNGVHSYTWTSPPFRKLFDKHLPGWANEPELFVRIGKIPDPSIWSAHQEAKSALFSMVKQLTGVAMDPDILTIGFARRATAYKRADLLFSDMDRLRRIGRGRLQVVYAGKAHPRDGEGKHVMERIHAAARELGRDIPVVYLPGYNMDMGLKLVSGVDVWLNNPLRPREASGTSGMKAAHNGVVNFSVLDGWWIEGHIEEFTGWSIGPEPLETGLTEASADGDADDLYAKLEKRIIPRYYEDRHTWIRMMQNAIGKNAYYFNTHRMMRRYVTEAYIR